jgi:AcrR family transcriptional regulator
MAKTPKTPSDRLIDAMLACVGEQGWRGLSLDDVAARAKLSAAQTYAVCPVRAELLNMYARRVDLAAVADMGPAPEDPEARYDLLLDIMMQRFEALEPDRQAVKSIIEDAIREPETVLHLLPQSQRSFAFLAGAAGYTDRGPRGCLFAKALAGVWLATQRVWLRDESAGLAETMAALDKNLRRAFETFASLPGRPLGPQMATDAA